MVTTWPVLAEALYLVGRVRGWQAQQMLWDLINDSVLELATQEVGALERMQQLMEQYRTVPMGLADASLVALAEERRLDQIFTLDSDFHIYRIFGRRHFTAIP
jgi:predicted nucleic acid-binding protein